jgi:K+-transporting ATPase A subunit
VQAKPRVARLVAIPILAGLVGLMWLDHVLFDSTGVAGVIGLVLFVAITFFAWVLVVGRSTDAD